MTCMSILGVDFVGKEVAFTFVVTQQADPQIFAPLYVDLMMLIFKVDVDSCISLAM